MTTHLDPVQWFDPLGTCKCGAPATGTLRGPRNESFGVSCAKCATKRVLDAHKARETQGRADRAGGYRRLADRLDIWWKNGELGWRWR